MDCLSGCLQGWNWSSSRSVPFTEVNKENELSFLESLAEEEMAQKVSLLSANFEEEAVPDIEKIIGVSLRAALEIRKVIVLSLPFLSRFY